eukprot:218904_1
MVSTKCLVTAFNIPMFIFIYMLILYYIWKPEVSIPDQNLQITSTEFHNQFVSPLPIDFAPNILTQSLLKTQQSYEEYSFLTITILSQQPSNVLVFGCGFDSYIYIYSNRNGYTLLLEDNLQWVSVAKQELINSMNMTINTRNDFNFDILGINYTTHWKEVAKRFKNNMINITQLNDVQYDRHKVNNINWRVILVDAPAGHSHGRIQSIYIAYNLVISSLKYQLKHFNEHMKNEMNNNVTLSKDNILVHLFIHDANRMEGQYAKIWFGYDFIYFSRNYYNERYRTKTPNAMMYFKCDLSWLNNKTLHQHKNESIYRF